MAKVLFITALISAGAAVLVSLLVKALEVDAGGWDAGIAGGVGGAVGAILAGRHKKSQESATEGE